MMKFTIVVALVAMAAAAPTNNCNCDPKNAAHVALSSGTSCEVKSKSVTTDGVAATHSWIEITHTNEPSPNTHYRCGYTHSDYHTQPTEANGRLGTTNCACCECSAGGANSALIGTNADSHHSEYSA